MLLIRNGRVIDPARRIDARLDVLIHEGRIARIASTIDPRTLTGSAVTTGDEKDLRIVDAAGKIVSPGLIDLHTHLREPGYEGKETIATGCKAAAAGGFTGVACMANTSPVHDNPILTHYILHKAREEGCIRVYPVGAVTRDLKGEALTDLGGLQAAGVVAVSDDGEPIMNAEIMRRALEYAKGFDLLVISHCEDKNLSQDGVMHEGYVSTRLGLKGVPAAAEEIMVARDLVLAELTGSRIHVAHVSTAGSVELIRMAKARGIAVSAEVTPHHIALTDEIVASFDPNTKVNPPLRSEKHRQALIAGLQDGTIDVIATDHAPHDSLAKDMEYPAAASGMVGLETAVGVIGSHLIHNGLLTVNEAIAKLTINPARVLRIGTGTLAEGAEADVTILDLEREWVVDPKAFFSKSHNSAFAGATLRGRAIMTIVAGRLVWEV